MRWNLSVWVNSMDGTNDWRVLLQWESIPNSTEVYFQLVLMVISLFASNRFSCQIRSDVFGKETPMSMYDV